MRFVLLALILCGSAGRPDAVAAPAKLQVLTSILPVFCLTAQVAGDVAQVENLLGSSVDPHDFQFTPKERRRYDRADLVVINGLGMEPWLERLRKLKNGRPVVECTAGMERQWITATAGSPPSAGAPAAGADAVAFNPHVWLDPTLALAMVTNILTALQKADPANAARYATNAAACVHRLRQLDEEIRESLAPILHRHLVTQHDAFPYFARRYGLRIVGVLEEFPEVAPTARHLEGLKESIRVHGVKALFTEPAHGGKLARQFAADVKIRVASLDPLESGPLKADAYEEGMRRNVRSLRSALR